MPELPEVETVRRTLKNFVLHKTIDSIEVRYPRIIDGDVETFVSTLIHQSICDIDRYGKYLIFILDHDAFISHLRMEGKYNGREKTGDGPPSDQRTYQQTEERIERCRAPQRIDSWTEKAVRTESSSISRLYFSREEQY